MDELAEWSRERVAAGEAAAEAGKEEAQQRLTGHAEALAEALKRVDGSYASLRQLHADLRNDVVGLVADCERHRGHQSSTTERLAGLERMCREAAEMRRVDLEDAHGSAAQLRGTLAKQQACLAWCCPQLEALTRGVGKLSASETQLAEELGEMQAQLGQLHGRLAQGALAQKRHAAFEADVADRMLRLKAANDLTLMDLESAVAMKGYRRPAEARGWGIPFQGRDGP